MNLQGVDRAMHRSTEEIDRHVELVDFAIAQGQTPETGFALALRAALISPHFLFRVGLDPDPAMVTAWRCDATRIISFMFGDSSSKKTHPWVNSFDAHHDVSHHQQDAGKISELAAIGREDLQSTRHDVGRRRSRVFTGRQ